MAARARHSAIARQHRIEEQITTEIDLIRRESVTMWRQGCACAAEATISERVVELIERAQLAHSRTGFLEPGRAGTVEYEVRGGGSRGFQEIIRSRPGCASGPCGRDEQHERANHFGRPC